MADNGWSSIFLEGIHDYVDFGYLEKEIGLKILKEPSVVQMDKKVCLDQGMCLQEQTLTFNVKNAFLSKVLQRLLQVYFQVDCSIASKWSTTRKMTISSS